MSYLSEEAILWAVRSLKAATHPFMGITFLACKNYGLPVGRTARVSVDRLTKRHLDRHHRLDPDSEFLFQPFRSRVTWVTSKYASTGLQAINTQSFAEVFLHERGRPEWGLADDYVRHAKRRITTLGHRPTPLSAIAIWIGKDIEWPESTTLDDVIGAFFRRYAITSTEKRELFAAKPLPSAELALTLLQDDRPDLRAVAYAVARPPDADEPEGTLASVRTLGVGPANALRLDLGDRLTVIAGDNGLGKSFLLDVTWWAATQRWADIPATPFGRQDPAEARIEYRLKTDVGFSSSSAHFYPSTQSWLQQSEHPHVPGLYVYARVDGSFSIADDHRERSGDAGTMDFKAQEVWDGKRGQMEGLVRDCVRWQTTNKNAANLLEEVLKRVSPSDLGVLRLGEPKRLFGDPRPMPVICHPYDDVPVTHVSAGVRRTLAVAYMIVWAWLEHKWASEVLDFEPVRRVMLLVDELEAHLHPFWQRTILPALLGIGRLLEDDLEMQTVVSTHSPLVLASLEADFEESSDALYALRLDGAEVKLERLEFRKHGDVSSWLTSAAMGLGSARSREAERVIGQAVKLQLSTEPTKSEVEAVSRELMMVLPPDDQFWRRWTFFARQAGVKL